MYEAARERPPTVTPSFLEQKIVASEMLAKMLLTLRIKSMMYLQQALIAW